MTTYSPAGTVQRRKSQLARSRERSALLLTIPAIAAICLLVLYPLGYSINQSFRSVDGLLTTQNYDGALHDPAFRAAVWNTVRFTVIMVTVETLLGLAVALALQEIGRRARSFFRAAFMIPLLVAPVVGAYQWMWLLNDQYGAINALLGHFHVQPPLWLSSPHWAFFAVILVDVWIATPFAVLVFQSALSSLPSDVYEAARLDGASRLQSFWFITRPLLKPAFLIIVVIRTMDAFRIYDVIAVLTGGGPGNATGSLSLVAVKTGIGIGNLNIAAAMSILTLLPILVATLVFLRLIRFDR